MIDASNSIALNSAIVLVYEESIDPQIVRKTELQTASRYVFSKQQFADHEKQDSFVDAILLTLDTDSQFQYRLSLSSSNSPRQVSCVDFNSAAFVFRLQHSNTIKQTIARAIGLKKGHRPLVIDTTAGLGRDGFLLASLGCNIIFVERSAVVHALLEDGLRRATQHTAALQHIQLILADSVQYLDRENIAIEDVIYLDPMFPSRSKHALVKKEMRMLQQVLEQETIARNDDIVTLFNSAKNCGARRIVVKRPKGSGHLCHSKPSFDIRGKTTRYDVYLCH